MDKEIKEFINQNSDELTVQAVEKITDDLLRKFIVSLTSIIDEGRLPNKSKYGRKTNVSCLSNTFADTFYDDFVTMVVQELKKGEK
jgi:hypothetical protein